MILVDSSIWVGHLRTGNASVVDLLEAGEVLGHPLVIGELACGNIRNRAEVLRMMAMLPEAPSVTDPEALMFIEKNELMGRGIGYIDVHLLASAVLADDTRLWTADARLASAAARLGVAYD